MESTLQYLKKLDNVDNLEDLKNEMLNILVGMRKAWSRKVKEIIEKFGYSNSELARLCGVSRPSIIKWLNGSIPQNRETFIRFGFAAKYNITELNLFLNRYGRYPELYAKNPEDCVYMYVLNSNEIEHTYDNCLKIFSQLEGLLHSDKSDTSVLQAEYGITPTVEVSNKLSLISEFAGFEEFIRDNREQFLFAYDKFYDYVKHFVRINNEADVTCKDKDNRYFLANMLGWSTSMRQYIHKIYHGQILPKRREVISLGIHLNMNLDELNQLLTYAHMEPLYVKSPTECALIYALREADLNEVIEYGYPSLYDFVMDTIEQLEVIDVDVDISDM